MVSPWHILIVLAVITIPAIVIGAVVYSVVASNRKSRVSAAPVQFATPPGWYPDPGQQNRLRWFDGKAWTDSTSG
ncbi:DUF2510 domain-containing protein [Rhodococcoides fascians]|uniref:DUF2510 domain-containing protein n=1 Tax=Rhodococcoides fascians TaxID=1828 RepID=UPI00352FFF43